MKRDELESKTTISLSTSSRVDGLQRLIKLRKKALPEVIAWCTKITEEEDIDIANDVSILSKMIQLMFKINTVCNDDGDDDSVDDEFTAHVHCNLIHIDDQEHLPIPVFFIYFSNNFNFISVTYNTFHGLI